mmetsp:Transcript_34217/g.58533  ORF Transcript_34217/g.58533 Transcript_34217/m.58533 type:complete len:219 (-) Transcript_34217:98-754(-)
MSPTVLSATPSPCRMRICCPVKRRKGLPVVPVSAWIFFTTASYAALRASPAGNLGVSGGSSSSGMRCSGSTLVRRVRSCGSVSTASPLSGRMSCSWPAARRSASMSFIERPPSPPGTASEGQWLTSAFQMLKPSETSETAKEDMYCLNMLAKAAYSSLSYWTASDSTDMSAHEVIVECSAAGTDVAPCRSSNMKRKPSYAQRQRREPATVSEPSKPAT